MLLPASTTTVFVFFPPQFGQHRVPGGMGVSHFAHTEIPVIEYIPHLLQCVQG